MKRKFTEEQIIKVLIRNRKGETTKTLEREFGVSEPTIYNWKKKFSNMTVNEAKRLKELEYENSKHKKLVADLSFDIVMLKNVNSKKVVGLNSQRKSASYLILNYEASVRRTANFLSLNRSTMTYKPRTSKDEDLELRKKQLSTKHPRFGLPRIHFLLKREGLVVSEHWTARNYKKTTLAD